MTVTILNRQQTPAQNEAIGLISRSVDGAVQSVNVTELAATVVIADGLPKGDPEVEYQVTIAPNGDITAWEERFTESGLHLLANDGVANVGRLGRWHDAFGHLTHRAVVERLAS